MKSNKVADEGQGLKKQTTAGSKMNIFEGCHDQTEFVEVRALDAERMGLDPAEAQDALRALLTKQPVNIKQAKWTLHPANEGIWDTDIQLWNLQMGGYVFDCGLYNGFSNERLLWVQANVVEMMGDVLPTCQKKRISPVYYFLPFIGSFIGIGIAMTVFYPFPLWEGTWEHWANNGRCFWVCYSWLVLHHIETWWVVNELLLRPEALPPMHWTYIFVWFTCFTSIMLCMDSAVKCFFRNNFFNTPIPYIVVVPFYTYWCWTKIFQWWMVLPKSLNHLGKHNSLRWVFTTFTLILQNVLILSYKPVEILYKMDGHWIFPFFAVMTLPVLKSMLLMWVDYFMFFIDPASAVYCYWIVIVSHVSFLTRVVAGETNMANVFFICGCEMLFFLVDSAFSLQLLPAWFLLVSPGEHFRMMKEYTVALVTGKPTDEIEEPEYDEFEYFRLMVKSLDWFFFSKICEVSVPLFFMACTHVVYYSQNAVKMPGVRLAIMGYTVLDIAALRYSLFTMTMFDSISIAIVWFVSSVASQVEVGQRFLTCSLRWWKGINWYFVHGIGLIFCTPHPECGMDLSLEHKWWFKGLAYSHPIEPRLKPVYEAGYNFYKV